MLAMLRTTTAAALAAALTLLGRPAAADITYNLAPSVESHAVSGLQFDPAGGAFIGTNMLAYGPAGGPGTATPLYLNFTATFDHADPAAGTVTYASPAPDSPLFLLTALLPAPASSVVLQGDFIGSPTATSLGGGVWRLDGTLATRFGQAGELVDTAVLALTFDVGAPLGYQVLGGTLAVTSGASVPEPASAVLVAVGVVVVGVLEVGRRRGIKKNN